MAAVHLSIPEPRSAHETQVARPSSRARVTDPDQILVERMAAGDQAALRLLMDRHLDRLLAFARRMLRDPSDAEDVVQEVFLKAWALAHKWQPGQARFDTWLHRITHNQCIDRLRRRRSTSIDDVPEPVDPSPSADSVILERQRADRVNRAIATLPDSQRAAIGLCHGQGLGNIEAAAVLGISVEALESLLARGRRKLREVLARDLAILLDGAGRP